MAPYICSGTALDRRPGVTVTLIGPCGSGKSTLLKGLARLLWPQHGTVLLDGQAVDTEHLNRKYGVTILMALHNIQHAVWFSRWLVVMQEGWLVVQGVPAEVRTEELMVDVFGVMVRIYPEEEAGRLLCIVLGSCSDATARS